jgi:hypothetical protein
VSFHPPQREPQDIGEQSRAVALRDGSQFRSLAATHHSCERDSRVKFNGLQRQYLKVELAQEAGDRKGGGSETLAARIGHGEGARTVAQAQQKFAGGEPGK